MTGCSLIVQGTSGSLPLPDASVDLIVTSPPYWALRSYQDGDEHYAGQIGSEDTPSEYLEALWRCTAEWQRVLKPTGSLWVNLGDKMAGSGGHNNSSLSPPRTGAFGTRKHYRQAPRAVATRRDGPNRYKQTTDGVLTKSLLGLPWRYAIGCVDGRAGDRWVLRAEVIWNKPTAMPESVTDRVRRTHEQWFHLTRQGAYYASLDELRQPHAAKSHTVSTTPSKVGDTDTAGGRRNRWLSDNGGRQLDPRGVLPPSVWTVPAEPLNIPPWARERYDLDDHFAAFPQEWPRRIILGWSPPEGLVLDPFGGTGTVAGVARMLGRTGVSADLSHDYSRLAHWRIHHSGHFAKSVSRTDRDRQGAFDLAGGVA